MPTPIRPSDLPALLEPGMTVFVPGAAGEPRLLLDALRAHPERCAGVCFTGVFLSGINTFDLTTLHPRARMRVFLMAPALRTGLAEGRVEFVPIAYSAIPAYLSRPGRVHLALLQVAPPDAQGACSLGVAADFAPAVIRSGARLVAHVNPAMPRTSGAPTVPLERIAYTIEAEFPLLEYRPEPPSLELAALAGRIAGLVRDGDTVQLGIGRVQAPVWEALRERRGLRVHSGMITDAVLDLLGGAIPTDVHTGDAWPVTTGVALGTRRLYDAVREHPHIRFAPVEHTHNDAVLRRIDNLVAINSALEVDLFGQLNAEMLDGHPVSAPGGLADFLRGARSAPGGRGIVALPATARGGTASRIVPRLGTQALVTVARSDADYIVTEHGVAALRDLDMAERAHALIALAAPAFRPGLQAAWEEIRRNL
jgi:acyl-CoA hydrolase